MAAERGLAGEFGGDRIGIAAPTGSGWPAVSYALPSTHARAAALALAALVVVAVVVRTALAWGIETPWIMVDELLYSELAKSFAGSGELLIRDLPYGRLSLLYPVLIAPAWLADSIGTAYGLAKLLNAIVMCLVAVPVYLWARRLVSPVLSLVAAGLVLLLPAFVYTGTIMTENAFFPAFALAAYAFAAALERPTLPTQALALAAAALATTVRTQGVILFAILVLAIALKALLDARAGAGRLPGNVRPYLPMLGTLAVAAGAYVAWKLAQGASLASGFGAYAGVDTDYDLGAAARWTLRHVAELGLVVGVAPLAALVVLAGLAGLRGLPAAAERAFVAVAVSSVLLLVAQVGIYASRFVPRIEERNMVHVAPVLLLALVVWIGRGLPRPAVLASLAAVGSALLLLAIPLGMLLNLSILSDTFALIPLLRLDQRLSGGVETVRWLMVAGGFAAAFAFLLLPRRVAAVALPVAIAGYFVVGTNSVQGAVDDYSRNLRNLVPADASWVDARIGVDGEAPVLFGTTVDPFREAVALWQLEFWNRSVTGVYNLGAANPAGIPELEARFDPASGRIVGDDKLGSAESVLAATALDLAELVVGRDRERILYAVSPPLRVESTVTGVHADRWMGAQAQYDRFAGRAGTLSISLSRQAWAGPDKPGRVRIEVAPLTSGSGAGPPTATRSWTIHSRWSRTFRLRTPTPPFRAAVHIEPTFSPADYGSPDTRQLGAQVTFAFKPAR